MAKVQSPVRIALVGCGRIGSIRAECIASLPAAKLEYIVDVNAELGQQLAQQFHSKYSDNLEKILPEVDAVWISTQTDTHASYIKLVAASGKAVATEKPVAFTAEETAECFDVCEKNGIPFFVAFNRRSDPHFRKFKEALDKNGPAYIIRIVNRDHPIPAQAQLAHLGSIFEDFLIHDFDTATWLVGECPETLYASAKQNMPQLKGTDVVDTVLVHMSYPSGTQVSIEASRYSPGGLDQRLEAITGSATILANNPLRTELVVIDTEKVAMDTFNYSFPQRYFTAYKNEVQHFLDMILHQAKPRVTRAECLLVARLVQAATR